MKVTVNGGFTITMRRRKRKGAKDTPPEKEFRAGFQPNSEKEDDDGEGE